ncbi:MAG: phosphate ABC transporter permease subunit PstC [Rhodobacteraceae bacterium]|nr:phosphate ABC transporter permease subunit PstC [Paracoccaceae bacterium]
MLTHILILMVLALALLGFWLGKRKAILAATSLHSLPVHYASYVLLMTILPASLTLAIWSLAEAWLLHDQSLTLSTTNNTLAQTDTALKSIVVIIVAVLSLFFAMQKVSPEFRARNVVEKFILAALMVCAALAILTTVGIVVSMVFETAHFLNLHSWKDFFFGLDWSPNFHGDSALSILPLLWGTLYISCVALLVAVPVGLLSAIYLSEYASSRIRSIAKPLLEVLAGIPTIVYGLFALLTFGPFLRDLFGPEGFFAVGWMSDTRSVATAGIVMGIMLIPFISSLSDDIINAVPQSLRDGSFGLGATQSETIKHVLLPAALPGIVGAILLAASRAIGETMIVVLGAGAIARFTGNPLEALTTVTTRIVSQLTGDGDFNSPETLVAFALGLTLFALTLGLNIFALYYVRKYREQYE